MRILPALGGALEHVLQYVYGCLLPRSQKAYNLKYEDLFFVTLEMPAYVPCAAARAAYKNGASHHSCLVYVTFIPLETHLQKI